MGQATNKAVTQKGGTEQDSQATSNKINKKQPSNFKNDMHKFLDFLPFDYIIAAFCASFCTASFISLITTAAAYTDLTFLSALSPISFIICMVVVFAGQLALSVITKAKQVIPSTLLASAVAFGAILAYNNPSQIYFNIGIGFVMFLVVAWVAKDDKIGFTKLRLPKKSLWIIAVLGALLFTVTVSLACIARYHAYMTYNFDFGIFAQMFENMRTTGLPNTTVERNTLMSHFGVHFSPIYYLLLPLYMIVPRPETLLVLQALFVAAGVFAVVLLCKKLNLSTNITIAFTFIYLFFPSLSNGCLYDFHENKFLTVLILWTLYFVISKNTRMLFVFAVLTLMVKEDAAIYIMAIALYIILGRKQFIKGGILFAVSIIYFAFATNMVAALGDGIMINRLDNYIPAGEAGFLAVAKTCFFNLGYFISQIFTADKIAFMIWMFLPLAFAPFMGEKKAILLLLVPMLVVDLMSNWQYQYDINYQYTFGVAALLIFMAIMTVQGLSRRNRHTVVLMSCAMCFIMSFSLFYPRVRTYTNAQNANKTTVAAYNDLIATVPKDASVTADNNYIPYMYNFTDLYMYPNYYGSAQKTEYYLVSSGNIASNADNLKTFMGDSYQLIGSAGAMQLYKLK